MQTFDVHAKILSLHIFAQLCSQVPLAPDRRTYGFGSFSVDFLLKTSVCWIRYEAIGLTISRVMTPSTSVYVDLNESSQNVNKYLTCSCWTVLSYHKLSMRLINPRGLVLHFNNVKLVHFLISKLKISLKIHIFEFV